MRPAHLPVVTLTALASLALVAGCGSDSTDSGDAPSTIRIAYQAIPNGDLIVKHDQALEKAFGDNVTIEWNLFDSGGSVNEAVAAGSVDIGLVGSSPTSRGLSSGLEYQVPWIFDVIGDAEALVVKGDVGIADLAGKTIATPFASTSHFSLLAALKDAGVDESSVNIIDSEPDAILAAWQAGQIDGAYVWNPTLAELVGDGGTVLVSSAELATKGYTTYDLAIVTDDFAETYPEAVQTWLDAENAAVTQIKEDPAKAAEAIAAELNITPEEAASQLKGLIFLDASEQAGADYLGGGLAKNLYDSAVFNKDLGKIDEVQPESDYTDNVVATWAAAAG